MRVFPAPRRRRSRRFVTALSDRYLLWWLLPLVAAAGAAGIGLQGFIAFLWIVAKEHVR